MTPLRLPSSAAAAACRLSDSGREHGFGAPRLPALRFVRTASGSERPRPRLQRHAPRLGGFIRYRGAPRSPRGHKTHVAAASPLLAEAGQLQEPVRHPQQIDGGAEPHRASSARADGVRSDEEVLRRARRAARTKLNVSQGRAGRSSARQSARPARAGRQSPSGCTDARLFRHPREDVVGQQVHILGEHAEHQPVDEVRHRPRSSPRSRNDCASPAKVAAARSVSACRLSAGRNRSGSDIVHFSLSRVAASARPSSASFDDSPARALPRTLAIQFAKGRTSMLHMADRHEQGIVA